MHFCQVTPSSKFWVARLAFLTPNFTYLALFRGSWRQKNCLAFFGGSSQISCYGVLAFW